MTFETILTEHEFTVGSSPKSQGHIVVKDTPVKMPATFIKGSKPGKQILITGGVHGGEYPCIETVIQLAKRIDPKEISGSIVIIHPVNVPAFLAKLQYYGPFDGKNLNRVFPGKALGTVSERIAYTVHQFQQAADFFIDLHGGDLHESLVPFVIYSKLGSDEMTEQARKMSAALGFPYVVGSVSDNGSIGAAAKAGTPGFLAELGQCGRWSDEEVETYVEASMNVLRSLEVIQGDPIIRDKVAFLSKMAVTTSNEEGCWYPNIKLEDQVKKGEKVGETRDFFGNVLREYRADEDGIILYLVTSLAIKTGDPLLAIGVV